MDSLKNYRNKELLWYNIGQFLIIILFNNCDFLKYGENNVEGVFLKIFTPTVFSSILFVFSFVFDSMFGDAIKYYFLFFGFPKPGEVIFDKIISKNADNRISKKEAKERYKYIYENMPNSKKDKRQYENSNWYSIYHNIRDKPMIFTSHRDYLLCRDIYFSTIVVLILYVFLVLLLKEISFSWQIIVFETVMLISSNIAARQRGNRFVANVIVYDMQNPSIVKTNEI